MGATIDDLQIRLQGDSKSANKEIDTVIKNLQNLSTALGGFKSVPGLQSITKAFNEMKTATNGIDAGNIKNISNSIRSLASSLMSLDKSARSLNLSAAENQMKVLDGIIKNESMKLMKDWGISAKDSAGVVESAIKRIVTSYKGISERGNSVFGKGAFDDAVQSIKPLITYMDKTDTSYQGLLDHIAKTNSNSKVFLPFSPSDFPDFDVMRATLGKAFSTSAAGATDLTAYVRDLNATLGHTVDIGTSDQETFENLYRVVANARSEVERANASFQRMVTESGALQSAINGVVRAVSEMNAVSNNGFGIQNKIPTAEMQGSNFEGLARQIGSLGGIDLSNIGDTSKLADLARNISQLGHKGITQAVANLPQLTEGLKRFVEEINKVGEVSFNAEGLSNLTNSISRLGTKTSTVAVENIPKLQVAIKNLLTDLSKAPAISDNTVRSLEAMANIAQKAGGSFNSANNGITGFTNKTVGNFGKIKNAARKVISAFGKVAVAAGKVTGINKLVNGIRNLIPATNKAQTGFKGLAKNIAMLSAGGFLVSRAFGKIKSALDPAMDYVEEYDYFKNTFNELAKNADLSQWKELGYKSAEAYAQSFRERAEKVTSLMTGYSVDENGALFETGEKNLGLNPTEVMHAQALFGQMSNSMGVATETASKLSRVYTKLGADMASAFNLPFEQVYDNLQSSLTGMSRAVDKYGVNIRNAAMQEELHRLGIDASISKLSQQDKVLLRTIITLNSTKQAWGNLAQTISSPSNQIRLLSQNFEMLSQMLGSLFLPIVSKVLPYINALVIAFKSLVSYVGGLLGVDLSDYMKGLSIGGDSEALSAAYDDAEDLSSGLDDVGKSADKAAKKQEKFNKQLSAFDELNNLTTTETTKNPKSSTSGSDLSGVGADLTAALDDAISKYEAAWKKAFEGMENDANNIAKKIKKAFVKAWTTGSGYELGKAFAQFVNKGISWYNKHLPTFKNTAKKIAGILATAVNGAIWNADWKGLGKAISGSITAYLDANTKFYDDVEWEQLGRGLADALNEFVDGDVFESYFSNIGSKIRAAIETAFGFTEDFNFDGLGEHIANGLNKLLGKMDKKINGLSGWKKLGKVVSNTIKGTLNAATRFLKKFNWKSLGKGISDAIKAVDFRGIAISFTNMTVALFKGVRSAVKEVDWRGIGRKIGEFLSGIKWGEIVLEFGKLAIEIVKAIGSAILGISETSAAPVVAAVVGLFSMLKWTTLGSKTFSSLATQAVSSIASALGAKNTVAGTASIGSALKALLTTAAGATFATSFAVAVTLAWAFTYKQKKAKIDPPEIEVSEVSVEFKDLQNAIDNLKTSAKNTEETINGLSFKNDTIGQEKKSINELVERYKELNKKTHLTAEEKAEMKRISEKLIQIIPSLKDKINETTGAYKGEWKEIKKAVKQTIALKKAQAAEDDLVAIDKQKAENKKAMEETQTAIDKAKGKYESLSKDAEKYNEKIKELFEDINKNGDEGGKKLRKIRDLQTQALKDSNGGLMLVKDEVKVVGEIKKQYKNATMQMAILQGEQNKLKEAEKEEYDIIADANGERKKSVKTIKEIYRASKKIKSISITTKISKKTKEDVNNITKFLDKSKKKNIVTLMAKANQSGDYKKIKKTWDGFKDKAEKVLTAALDGKLDKKSYNEVMTAWNSLSNNDKKTIKAQLKGEELESFYSMQEAFKNLKDKDLKVNLKSGTVDTSTVDKKLAGEKDKTVKVNAKSGNIDTKSIDKEIERLNKQKVTLKAKGDTSGLANLTKKIKTLQGVKKLGLTFNFKSQGDYDKIYRILNNNVLSNAGKQTEIKKTIALTFKADKFVPEGVKNMLGLASGGILKGGKWNPIQRYASGGFPSAQVFMAREAGPELVGTIGNHTAVMNNDQIVASVSDGVFNALNPVLTRVANALANLETGGATASVEGLSNGDIVRIVKNEDTAYRRRTGKGMFA